MVYAGLVGIDVINMSFFTDPWLGVAALIVSAHGRRDPVHGGLTLDPRTVAQILTRTATQTPCPSPPNFAYPDDQDPTFEGVCEGTLARNGIYGKGIVNALTAVLD